MDSAPVRTDLWEVLAGRVAGAPLAPDDPDLWEQVSSRLNVARARPRLRPGVEAVAQTTVRGQPYVMLRSPDRQGSYVRLAPEEWALAQEMDGQRSVAVLVGVLARATGSLAPDRVTRVVADLAANRMLEELPVDAFAGVQKLRSGTRRSRLRRRLLDAARGRRMVLGDVDDLVGLLYRAGGRLLFTRAFAVLAGLVSLVGAVLFLRTWTAGSESLFLTSGSYAAGGLLLLALNGMALLAHELGHALATKHAGRRVPAVGVLLYFGIPSAFVDTTDIWMASRKHRLIATAAGPISALTLAGFAQVTAFAVPELAPLAFKISFAWYLNALFNLNPLMALDGYYLAMDALEINNLRARGLSFLVGTVRSRRLGWAALDREARYVAAYGAAAALWTLIFVFLSTRIWRDRVSGLAAGLWHTGPAGRAAVLLFLAGLFAPVLWPLIGLVVRRGRQARAARERQVGLPARTDALRGSRLGELPPPVLTELAGAASWSTAPPGAVLQSAGVQPGSVLVLTDGDAEARRPGDPPATVRVRAGAGDLLGATEVLAGRASALEWRAGSGARVLVLPAAAFSAAAGPLLSPPGTDLQAAEAALDAAPALTGLSPAARGELLSRMACVDVPPGKVVTVSDPAHAVLVGAGLLAADDGERRSGDVLCAAAEDAPLRLRTRTRTTLWRLPGFASLGGGALAAAAPPVGAHGGGGHPPVTPSPSPEPAGDDETDDRLWRRTRWLLLLLLLITFLSGASALAEPTPWAEVPDDRVLVVVQRGTAVVDVAGRRVELDRGGRIGAGADDRISVGRRSTVHLLYAGGARQVLCGGSRATVVAVARTQRGRTVRPSGTLRLERGALLADTRSTSEAFAPLALQVDSGRLRVTSTAGPSRFGVTPTRLDVRAGDVVALGRTTAAAVDCRGDAAPAGSTATAPAVAPTPGAAPARSNGAAASAAPGTGTTPTPAPAGSTSPPASTSGPTLAPPGGTSAAPTTAPSAASTLAPTTAPPTTPPPRPTPTARPTPSPTPAPAPDLRWSCQPTSLSFPAGGAAKTACDATSVNGYTGGVTYACEGVPPGMSCAPSPTSGSVPTGGTAGTSFGISGGRGLAPGTYPVDAVVRSADSSIVRRVTLTVTVT